MPSTIRFTVCSLNLWESSRWADRREAVRRFLGLHTPDLFCVQELRPQSREWIDQCLPGHRRVEDAFPGWAEEGNLYCNTALFDLEEHGAEDIGQEERNRRLFWARIGVKGSPARLLVSTAHFTWPGHRRERESGLNLRIGQAGRCLEALDRLASPDQPLLFMGDLNEHYHTLRILEEGGLKDSFAALGRRSPPTRPAAPTFQGPAETLDWILHRGALRPMSSEVVHFHHGDVALSDHWPVLATYTLI